MNPWLLVSVFTLLGFWLRTFNRYPQVFGLPNFVNFIETDAWFHVRIIEHMAHHFPYRLRTDPFGRIDGGQSVDTGLFFDAIPAFVAWVTHLTPLGIHQLAAWYPAILGALIIPVTFLCGRAIISEKAGLWAAAVVATIPGHFLHTGSLGFVDHHVMEALLTSVLLWLLTRAPRTSPLFLGATLAAYLLSFAGGAFIVAIITLWYWLEAARGEVPANGRDFALACLIAAPFTLWQIHVYFMRYSAAAVILAGLGLWFLPLFANWCQQRPHPRLTFIGATALTLAIAVAAAQLALAGQESLFAVIGRMTASNSLAGTVRELQSLTYAKGYFSLEYPWQQFGGAFITTLIALPLLAENVWRRPNQRHTLLLLWSAVLFVMTMSQARMTYYFGVTAALLAGYLMNQVRLKSVATVVLAALLLIPNFTHAVTDAQVQIGQITPDWIEALTYLRTQTPPPFADPQAFNGTPTTPPAYSVLAWWDFGYWITTVAQRVPVTNPTQNNAGVAADFFLATTEPDAREALTRSRAGYVVLNNQLVFIGDQHGFHGYFLSLFPYTGHRRPSDYVFDVREKDETGHLQRRLFFRAPYFETMAFRLYVTGGKEQPAIDIGNFAVIEANGPQLVSKQQFSSLEAARAAAVLCPKCELVSENPLTPMIDLPAVNLVKPVFGSSATGLRWHGSHRQEIQIYQVR